VKQRQVYYISGNTGLLAKDLGKALLSQFPGLIFIEETIPFVRNIGQAQAAYQKITDECLESSPIVISTLFSKELNTVFNQPGVFFFTIFDYFLKALEKELDTEAIRRPGTARHQDNRTLASRVDAIHYSMCHDDGTGLCDYDDAELILLGVSRSGKTPICLFLATQLGIKSANHPLIDRDLEACTLPAEIRRNSHKTIALTMDPVILAEYRENRLPGSVYAALSTCRKEILLAEQIYAKYTLKVIQAGGSSIEETAMQVIGLLNANNS
jgi:regulator of PEP synthase PpsR (kinase-PPPase family)